MNQEPQKTVYVLNVINEDPFSADSPNDKFAPRGAIIGRYKDMPIFESITERGKTLEYAGIVAINSDGSASLSQLKGGDLIFPPGLLYRPINVSQPNNRDNHATTNA